MGDKRTDWRLVLLLWGAGLGAAAQYGKVSVAFGPLAEVYPDAGAALGWAVSLVGVIGILFGVVAGVLVSRITLRRAMLWGLWLGAGVSVFQALLPGYPVFLLSRVLEGISHLALVVAAPTLIAGLSADKDRGFTLTLWGTFFGVAFALLVWFGLPLVKQVGVGALFLAHGLYMAVFALVLMPLIPRDDASSHETLSFRSMLDQHLAIYRSPFVSAPAAGWLFYTLCFVSLLTLLPPYLDAAYRTAIIGAMPLVSIVSSLVLGVWLLRFLSSVAVVQIGFVASALCALALAVWQGQLVLCLLLAAMLGLIQGASFAAVPDLNDRPEARAQGNGALAQAGNLGNTLGTPVLLYLATLMGYGALMLGAATALFGGWTVHWLLAAARRRRATA